MVLASIYDTKTLEKDYESRQKKLKFKLCFVKKYQSFRKLKAMKHNVRK